MTQYNTLNLKLYSSQLKRLKSGIENATEVTFNLSSNVIGNSNEEFNFPQKLLLADAQVLRLCKVFVNSSSANIKLSKTQLYKMGQPGGFLGRILGSLLKADLYLIKNVLKPLAGSILIPLGLTAAASATGITTSVFSNEELNDVMKIVKPFEDAGLLIKRALKQPKWKQKS